MAKEPTEKKDRKPRTLNPLIAQEQKVNRAKKAYDAAKKDREEHDANGAALTQAEGAAKASYENERNDYATLLKAKQDALA